MTDPYLSGLVSENPFHKKLPVSGSIAAVLSLKYDKPAASDDPVDRIFCLGFFEVSSGGIVVEGDTLKIGDRVIGTVAGFNSDHMPNHLNIIEKTGT